MNTHKKAPVDLSPDDEAQVQLLLTRRQAIAEELHGCTSRAQAEQVLAPVISATQAIQLALLKSLGRTHDSDSADLLLALHELAPEKETRKEARRVLIQLTAVKVFPSWTPAPEATAAGVAVDNPPRFWKGMVAEVRETGELQLTLCWEYGVDFGEARMISFLLDFWHEGVKDFFVDTGTKRHIDDRLKHAQQRALMKDVGVEGELPTRFVACTLAEGRRLLNEALSVNRWRKTEPHKEFRQALSLVQRLILHESEVGEDRGLSFISHDLDPDGITGNFVGGWSMGDYGLCYDLLAHTSPLLEGHTRDEWVEMRRRWADEARPARFELYVLQEREPAQQSSLWLPSSVLSARAASYKEAEICWSLQLMETPLSGTLPEMPLATAVFKETGRHWFWMTFILEHEQQGWRIARVRDEGAALQALPLEELRKRITEHEEAIQKIIHEHQPTEANAQKYLNEIILRTWKLLVCLDALLVKNPLDKAVYTDAYDRAVSVRAIERAAVYAEALVTRFPQDADFIVAQQRLGNIQIALSERFSSQGLHEQAGRFMDMGEATLRGTLSTQDPLGYLLVAELLMNKRQYEEAEKLLLEARAIAQESDVQAQIEFDLAGIAVDQQHFADAQHYLERLIDIDPHYPGVWSVLGYVQHSQHNEAAAEVSLLRSIEEEPTEERAYTELAALYVDQRELNKARDVVSQGMRALPQSAALRALMALVYVEKGDTRRAQEYLVEAEHMDPDLEISGAIRELLKKK